jgi:hypothetical protein
MTATESWLVMSKGVGRTLLESIHDLASRRGSSVSASGTPSGRPRSPCSDSECPTWRVDQPRRRPDQSCQLHRRHRPPGRSPPRSYTDSAGAARATTIDNAITIAETLAPGGRVLERVVTHDTTQAVTEVTVYGYSGPGDRPAYTRPAAGGPVTAYIGACFDTAGTATWQSRNDHGDWHHRRRRHVHRQPGRRRMRGRYRPAVPSPPASSRLDVRGPRTSSVDCPQQRWPGWVIDACKAHLRCAADRRHPRDRTEESISFPGRLVLAGDRRTSRYTRTSYASQQGL